MARSPLRWIQQQLFVRGIEIRKFPTAEFRPLRVFDLAAQAIMAARGEPLRFVQVGANDGSFVDPIRPYIVECGWRGMAAPIKARANSGRWKMILFWVAGLIIALIIGVFAVYDLQSSIIP